VCEPQLAGHGQAALAVAGRTAAALPYFTQSMLTADQHSSQMPSALTGSAGGTRCSVLALLCLSLLERIQCMPDGLVLHCCPLPARMMFGGWLWVVVLAGVRFTGCTGHRVLIGTTW